MKFKKIAAAVLAAAVLAATPATVRLFSPFSVTANAADTLTEGDYEYSVNEDGETVTITKYTGSDTEVEIPGSLGGKTVTKIGESAFYDYRQIRSVTIPDSVTTIGNGAFNKCALTSVTIPDSVLTIGDEAFCSCASLESVTIPDSVLTIGDEAFCSCASLESVTIPYSVTTIGHYAFSFCDSLKEIIVEENNTDYISIEGVLFNDDKSELMCYPRGKEGKSYVIPDNVTAISDGAFGGSSLTNITIPDSVTTIGDKAFFDCSSLISVTIPDGVTTIGDKAFYDCNSLTSVTIPDGVTTIGDSAFNDCISLTSVTIGEGVITIGDKAFYRCYNVPNITLPSSVTTIGNQGFAYCYELTSVTIPDSVTTIGDEAFYCCKSLTSVTIPYSVTTIGHRAFGICDSLKEIIVEENNTDYLSIDGVLFNGDKSELMCYPGGKEDKSYVIPNTVTAISDYAFIFSSLTSITMPDGATTIEEFTFGNCESLISITIPDSVITIGENGFHNCPSLEDIYYGGSKSQWEKIAVGYGNKDLLNATIHFAKEDVVESDTNDPEESDTSEPTSSDTSEPATSDTSEPTESDTSEPTSSDTSEPTESDTSEPTSSDTSEPTSSDTSEPTTSDTSEPTSSDTSEPTTSDTSEPTSSDTSEPITSDTSEPTSSDTSEPTSSDTETLNPGDYFVYGGLEYTVLKDGTLEVRGFAGDEAKDIVIPETVKGKKVTSIGDAAFIDCTSLTSVTIPDSVTRIGGYAFSGCTSLDTVNYGGTKSDWKAIDIDIENEALTNAEIKCTDGIINEREPETSEPTTSDTSEPADPDLFLKENEVSAEIDVPTEAADIPETDRITSITINPAFNMKNKHDNNVELDLSKITIKAEEIYDKEGLKRAEEALGETLKGNKHYNLLDLTLLYNGEDFSNGYEGLVKVIIPLPKGHRDKTFTCFRLTEVDGKMVKEVIPGEQTEDSYIIYLEHFSLYALVADAAPDNGEENPEQSASSNPSDADPASGSGSGSNTGTDQKPTGMTLAIAPVMLAVGAAVMFSKKRK